MRIVYANTAENELEEVWLYNAERYGTGHAESYRAFLKSGIDALATEYDQGKSVEHRSGFRYTTFRRASQGHGHIVVYRVDEATKTIRVLHIYHTAQDWQGRLGRERPR